MAAAQPCQHPRRSVLIDMGELVSDFIHYNYDDEDRNLYDSDIVALATKAKGGKVPARETDDALQTLRPTAERILPIVTGLFAASAKKYSEGLVQLENVLGRAFADRVDAILAPRARAAQGPLATSSDLDLAYVVFPVELWFELLSCQGVDILHLDLYERVVLGMVPLFLTMLRTGKIRAAAGNVLSAIS
eukprot:tig00021045_g17659.t1